MNQGAESVRKENPTQRLDKWLWFARLTKTRTLASELVLSGKVRVNRVRTDKPSQTVREGDVITVVVARRVRVLRVQELGLRRGPASVARQLYEDLTPEPDPNKPLTHDRSHGRGATGQGTRPGYRAPGAGRPTKKERREIDRLNEKSL